MDHRILPPQEIIRLKRDAQALSVQELAAFFGGFMRGEVADYQMGAMLMAIAIRGMTPAETSALTGLMRDSGEVLAWPYPPHLVVDKHSTGGIGDKTSLIVLPLVLLAGLKVPMMAGRGLGHTGGTLDKLEAVGWRVFFDADEARAQMASLGGIIMGQTTKVAPLDRRLYAMRDVTATVESIPLIVGSILSKKLASGIGGLVMDVKYGSGAFMAKVDDARALAQQLRRVGQECGLAVRCVLSDMGSPLGTYAGHALEIYETIQVLQNTGPADTRELSLTLASEMVLLAHPQRQLGDIRRQLEGYLRDGSAWQMFLRIAEAQGGDLRLLDQPHTLLRAPVQRPVLLPGASSVAAIDARQLGMAILELGGGRRLVADKIDPWVGLSGLKRVGATLAPGEPVAIIHAQTEAQADVAARIVAAAFTGSGSASVSPPLILEML
jgi:pyrimidine-nucleoside phosphorylase/thymidine phosphorylase